MIDSEFSLNRCHPVLATLNSSSNVMLLIEDQINLKQSQQQTLHSEQKEKVKASVLAMKQMNELHIQAHKHITVNQKVFR